MKLRPPRLARLVLLVALVVLPAAALADPPADFAQRVESLRQSLGVPGAAVASPLPCTSRLL